MGLLARLFQRRTPPISAHTLGRNELCWCGSGTKYKHCHHDRDQAYFARVLATRCSGST